MKTAVLTRANLRFSFKLKDAKSDKPTSIRMVVYHRYFKPEGRFVYGTGENILPEYFDVDAERPVKDKFLLRKLSREEQRDLTLLEDRLNDLQAATRKVSERFIYENRTFDAATFREQLLKYLNGGHRIKRESLHEYLDRYIEEIKEKKRLTESGKVFAPGSVKNYLTFRSQFELFQKEKRRTYDFGDINQDFYNEFLRFLNAKEYSPNTIGKHFARLKKVMRSAVEENLYDGTEHDKKYFKVTQIETEHVYLTRDELNGLSKLDLSGHPDMEMCRDVFVVGCHTAQRVSDYKSIRPEHVMKTSKGIRILKLIQQKTGEEVMIPINTELESLLEKYHYRMPKVDDNKLNINIKKAAKLAGINTLVEIEMIRGGQKMRKVFPKYELIHSHTARRTGATNMYLAGIEPIDIMKITGHKKQSNFMKYIRITKEENADRLAEHPYFQ